MYSLINAMTYESIYIYMRRFFLLLQFVPLLSPTYTHTTHTYIDISLPNLLIFTYCLNNSFKPITTTVFE